VSFLRKLNSYSKIDFHNNLEKRSINSNVFTELKYDNLELMYFCQAFMSRLIKISFSLEQNILFHQMHDMCMCLRTASCFPKIIMNIPPLLNMRIVVVARWTLTQMFIYYVTSPFTLIAYSILLRNRALPALLIKNLW